MGFVFMCTYTEIRFGNTFNKPHFPKHGHVEAEAPQPSDTVCMKDRAEPYFPISYQNRSLLFLLSFCPTIYQFGVIEIWGNDRRQKTRLAQLVADESAEQIQLPIEAVLLALVEP